MGNRAVIVWQDEEGKYDEKTVGIYLHWYGGRDAVEGFLAYCEMSEFRSPTDDCYGIARFAQVVANYLGGDGLSIGVDRLENLTAPEYADNGLYVCKDWRIVDRKCNHGEQREYPLAEFICDVNEKQPESLKQDKEKLDRMIREYVEKYREEKPAA